MTPGSTSLADYISGLYGAIGVLLSLRVREQTGRGQEIDIALYESIFRVLDEMAPLYAATGFVRPRLGLGTANVCPHGHFECGDGEWVAIACTSDKMWRRMAEVLGRPELGRDERYETAAKRVANRQDVDGLVCAFTVSMARVLFPLASYTKSVAWSRLPSASLRSTRSTRPRASPIDMA